MMTGAPNGLIAIMAETSQFTSVPGVASHSWSGYQTTASKNTGQPIVIRTKMARLMAIARPSARPRSPVRVRRL